MILVELSMFACFYFLGSHLALHTCHNRSMGCSDISDLTACRRFVVETLSNLIRLSYWTRIKSVVPASFHELLPPAPEAQPIPGPPEPAAAHDGSDDAMADGAADERDVPTKRAFEMLTMVSDPVPAQDASAPP